jgi:cysteine desulfurase
VDDFVYLDYNATTPVDPRVTAAIVSTLQEDFGNPSSGHALGRRARAQVDLARERVATLIGATPEEIVFNSGGSESNNAVIFGVAALTPPERRHLVISAVEHPAIVEPARALAARGWRVSALPVDGEGRVDPDSLAEVLTPNTALVSVMLANNEVGTIQPIADLAALCRAHGVPLHTDAAQAVGKIPVDVAALDVDFLSLAGHKFYATKGVGALFVRRGRELPPFVLGANQEYGRRAGTENVPAIVGLGQAAHLSHTLLDEDMAHSLSLRNHLLEQLRLHFDAERMRVNGPAERAAAGLPGTLSVAFRGLAAGDLLHALADHLAASAGAACNSDGGKVSAVLTAMGVAPEWARGTLRLSVGRMSAGRDVDRGVQLITEAVTPLLA